VLLAQHFRKRYCDAENRVQMDFSGEALVAIERYHWPGNVRELENCVKRGVIMADGPLIGADDLGLAIGGQAQVPVNLRTVRASAEYKAMVLALARSNGNVLKAAELLGISRPTLYDLMHHHGIRPHT
jgi:two-component system NtrC family response regulator